MTEHYREAPSMEQPTQEMRAAQQAAMLGAHKYEIARILGISVNNKASFDKAAALLQTDNATPLTWDEYAAQLRTRYRWQEIARMTQE